MARQSSMQNIDKRSSAKALDELFLAAGTYRKSSAYKELLEFVRRFPRLAPYTAMLIHTQCPGSRFVLTASQWEKRCRRYVRQGAKPMIILRPFGPVDFVFDMADTEGDPVPERLLDPFPVEGKVSHDVYKRLHDSLDKEGVLYQTSDNGPNLAGQITRLPLPHRDRRHGYSFLYYFSMTISSRQSETENFATMTHELGHMFCGHLGSPVDGWLPERIGTALNEKEFEAESVAWLVCGRQGLKPNSDDYLSGYLNAHDEIPSISLEAVLKAVTVIEEMLNGKHGEQKKLMEPDASDRTAYRQASLIEP